MVNHADALELRSRTCRYCDALEIDRDFFEGSFSENKCEIENDVEIVELFLNSLITRVPWSLDMT